MKQLKRMKGWMSVVALVLLTLVGGGCGGSGSGSGAVMIPSAAPSSVSAAPGNAQVSLNWTASPTATSYNIYYATSAGVTTASPNKITGVSGPHTVTGLTNGTPYFFVVTAVNAGGESAVSNEVSATPVAPPAKPSGVVVSGGDAKVTVSWTSSAGASSYNVYYATAPGVTTNNGTKVANVTSGSDLTGLTNGTPYYFVVTAVNAGGESAVSSEKSATPAALPQAPGNPTGVTVTAGPGVGEVSVSWATVPTATSYNVYFLQSATAPTTAAVLAGGSKRSAAAPATSLVVSGLQSGGSYYFSVTAVNAGGESGGQTTPKKPSAAIP